MDIQKRLSPFHSTLLLQGFTLLCFCIITIPALAANERFLVLEDGTVQDQKSGLNWAAKDNGTDIIWSEAISYCKNYSAGDHNDWRMPTSSELATLYGNSPKARDKDYADHIDLITKTITITGPYVWTAKKRTDNKAITFGFNYGTIKRLYRADGRNRRALPVR